MFSQKFKFKKLEKYFHFEEIPEFLLAAQENFFCLTSNRAFWVINYKEEVTWPALIRCRQIAALLNWSNSIQVYLAYLMVYDEWITYFIYPRNLFLSFIILFCILFYLIMLWYLLWFIWKFIIIKWINVHC